MGPGPHRKNLGRPHRTNLGIRGGGASCAWRVYPTEIGMRCRHIRPVLSLACGLGVAACSGHTRPATVGERPPHSPCFEEQVRIENFCVDKYEAYVVEVDDRGDEHPHSPYQVIGDLRVRAKVAAGVVPQAYISQVQAASACHEAGKRLCKPEEYIRACRGPNKSDFYPY